jgi:hypothetical protein
MSFTVPTITPPFTLPSLPPSSVITSTLTGLTPPTPDANFLNSILGQAGAGSNDLSQVTDGLFTNPLFPHMQLVDQAISSLQPLSSLASAADALPGAPGGAATALTTVISHMKDLTTMFSNMATNIVPVNLTMNPLISSAIGSMTTIGSQSAEAMKSVTPFIQNMGIPSMGTVLNQSFSEFNLNQLAGTVNAANPAPLLNHYATMLSSMASTAQNFLSGVASAISNVISSAVTGFQSAITGLLSIVESSITSFAAPIASFGSNMFDSVKNQMATGLATMVRHMTEVNPTFAFSITGSIGGIAPQLGSFPGMVTPNFASIMTSNPSPGAQAVAAAAPYSMPNTTALTTTSGPPDFTQQQVQLLQQAQSYVENAIKQQQSDLDAAVASYTAWKTSVNYQAVKDAQNDSPTAMAAYQALKTQAEARQDYMTGHLLLSVIPYNQGVGNQFKLIQNIGAAGLAATATNGVSGTFPSNNVVLYGGTQTAGSYTTTKYVYWTIASTLIAAGNPYKPVQL